MTADQPDILIVVPARGGSKRLPRKNIMPLCGKSLMERTQDAVSESGLSAHCLLSTDDADIAAEGRRLGWLVPFLRPDHLSGDDVPTFPVVKHAVDWYSEEQGRRPDMVMLLQVTSPFRSGEDIRRAVELLQEAPDGEAVVSVYPAPHDGRHLFWQQDEFLSWVVGERSEARMLAANGAIYLIRTDVLFQVEGFFARNTLPLLMSERDSLDIDTAYDWMIAESILGSS